MIKESLIYPTAILLWMVFYTLFYQVLPRLIPIPNKIAKTEDLAKRGREISNVKTFYKCGGPENQGVDYEDEKSESQYA